MVYFGLTRFGAEQNRGRVQHVPCLARSARAIAETVNEKRLFDPGGQPVELVADLIRVALKRTVG